MSWAQIPLTDESERILEVIKKKFGLKNKGDAVNQAIAMAREQVFIPPKGETNESTQV